MTLYTVHYTSYTISMTISRAVKRVLTERTGQSILSYSHGVGLVTDDFSNM